MHVVNIRQHGHENDDMAQRQGYEAALDLELPPTGQGRTDNHHRHTRHDHDNERFDNHDVRGSTTNHHSPTHHTTTIDHGTTTRHHGALIRRQTRHAFVL